MRAGTFEADVQAFVRDRLYQQPVRFDVTIPAAGEISPQRMIPVFERQRSAVNKQVDYGPEFRHVLASLLSTPDILLELVGPAEGPHKPRSA
jgi:hypothetical protein